MNYKAGKLEGWFVFFVLKAHRGPENSDKSWVRFENRFCFGGCTLIFKLNPEVVCVSELSCH